MTRGNLVKCEDGTKGQTRRCNERLAGIKAGDEVYFRSDYKTTYLTASGPYIATEDARWEAAQDISEKDALAEGIVKTRAKYKGACQFTHTGEPPCYATAREAFSVLWNTINKKPGRRWEDNPNVLRIAYRRGRRSFRDSRLLGGRP
jgi:hypothetical protein